MPDTYQVTFKNESNQAWKFFLYQEPPPDASDASSLAWLVSSHKIAVGDYIKFEWSIKYQLVWAESGELEPGVRFGAGGSKNADLTVHNMTKFSLTNNTVSLSDPATGGRSGSLTISDDPNIPPKTFSVGVAMSGKSTYVVNAGPNLKHVFTPQPSYWVCAMNEVREGDVLMDIETLTQNKKFTFPINVFNLIGTLNASNLWEISQS